MEEVGYQTGDMPIGRFRGGPPTQVRSHDQVEGWFGSCAGVARIQVGLPRWGVQLSVPNQSPA
jgi:hypothetical protein